MKTLAFLFITTILTGTVFASGQIDIAYSPYTITNPGSYIVVKNLTTAINLNCITINTSDVTIDLNGHTLYGPGTTSSGSSGIYSAVGDNITITNGAIRNFNSAGIDLQVAQAQISKVKVIGCGTGIYVDGGLIENNLVSQSFYAGIICVNNTYPAVITNNVVSYNDSHNSGNQPAIWVTNNCDITGNNVTHNNSIGIYVQSGNSKITGNSVNSNYNNGIWVEGPNCTITGNNVTNTINGPGITAYNGCNLIGNTVAGNGTYGIYGSYWVGIRVSENEVYSNVSSGITVFLGGTLTENNVYGNSGDGIDAGYGSLVRGNTLRANGGIGISANGRNRIEANNFDTNTVGIYISGPANTILNNSIWSNSTGLWVTSTANFYGGNIYNYNSISTSIAAGNSTGNGINGGFGDFVLP